MHYCVITGGRDADDETLEHVSEVLSFLQRFYGNDLRVLHGACPTGVDFHTQQVCDILGITVKGSPADWEGRGRGAGPIRNAHMADLVAKWARQGHTGECIAFRGGRGTASMMDEARRNFLEVTEIPEPAGADH